MTWARFVETGSGRPQFRLSIDGWPEEFVTASEMATSGSRPRRSGLRMGDFVMKETIDPITLDWKVDSFTAQVVDVGGHVTASLSTAPTARTYLSAEADASTTTITVKSNAAFASSGTLYVDSETITYAAKGGSTTFTGCTRGVWSTLAQYHYVPNGDRQRFAEVTDRPQVLEGRRATVYGYGAGDSKTGDGTQIWRGVVSTSPKFDGTSWSFTIDSITRVLAVDIGGDLSEPVGIRGIYYPSAAPLGLVLQEFSSAAPNTGTVTALVRFAVAGFWETQEEFCADLTDTIVDQMTNYPTSGTFTVTDVRAVPDGAAWAIEVTQPSTAKYFLASGFNNDVVSAVDGALGNRLTGGPSDLDPQFSMVASTVYQWRLSPGGAERPGTVPRTTFGSFRSERLNNLPVANQVGISTPYPTFRLYVGEGALISSDIDLVSVEITRNGTLDGVEFDSTLDGSDASTQRLDIATTGVPGDFRVSGQPAVITAANAAEVSITGRRSFGFGNLKDFIDTLVAQTAQYLNLGAAPDIQSGDFGSLAEITTAASLSPMAQDRGYSARSEVDLNEFIKHECRLLGIYPALDSSGRITFRRQRLPSQAEASSTTLTSASALTDEDVYTLEDNAFGLFNTVVIKTGYNVKEEEHQGDTFKVRDVSGFGLSPRARTLEIAPLSRDLGRATFRDAVQLAERLTGTYGGPYQILTVEVPLSFSTLRLGDVVETTLSRAPNGAGTLGLTSRFGLVLAREFTPRRARGILTLLTTSQKIGGYAPSSKVASISGTSGTTGPFTLTLSSNYFQVGGAAQDYWTAGDLIQVFEYASTTTTNNEFGTVVSAAGTSLVITTTAAWTHTGATWVVGSRTSDALSAANQKVYVMVADSSGDFDWSDESNVPAFTFAP